MTGKNLTGSEGIESHRLDMMATGKVREAVSSAVLLGTFGIGKTLPNVRTDSMMRSNSVIRKKSQNLDFSNRMQH